MIPATIQGKTCNTIEDFYALTVPKIRYSHNDKPIRTVGDFYNDFLTKGRRLPQKNVIEEWHKLLLWYIDQPDVPLLVRKYEGGKQNSEWDNRRGAVIQFDDGFEIVYASNFLAHDIFLMAYHGFVPSKDDFMLSIKNRKLHITSGTKVEKEIRLYPSANKGLSYCYLAHIMDVNGKYLREDGSYKKLSKAETEWVFPRGTASNWSSSPDKIWHIPRNLSKYEQELVKAHCLRFLDPMNYYLTPLTKHCTHILPGFKKNIGEFSCLTYYVQQQYRSIFKGDYDALIKRGKFLEQKPKGYTGCEKIDLKYSTEMSNSKENDTSVSVVPSKTACIKLPEAEDFLNELGDFMRNSSRLSEPSVRIYLGRIQNLLAIGYSVDTLCREIDAIIKAHRVGGQDYNPKDSGNTAAALKQVQKMIRYPYICYSLGYQSFRDVDEHLTGYCIDGDTITISKSRGFVPIGDLTKKIPKKHLQTLIELLEEANKNALFAKSNTCIRTTHGENCSYEYSYGRNTGKNCNALFKGKSPIALHIQKRYNDVIAKLTK